MKIIGFYEIQKEYPPDLHPQGDDQRLVDEFQRKGSLLSHSAAGEESNTSIEFLTRRICTIRYYTTTLKFLGC